MLPNVDSGQIRLANNTTVEHSIDSMPDLAPDSIGHIVILTSATGGGHTACARALQDAFRQHYGSKLSITIVDLWTDHAPWPLNRLPGCYAFFVRWPILWRFFWWVSAYSWIEHAWFNLMGRWVHSRVVQAFTDLGPDLIIAAHPLIQRGVRQVFQQLPLLSPLRALPWFTVVTDLVSAHPFWFDRGAILCFVPTDELHQVALDNQMQPNQLRQFGLPTAMPSQPQDHMPSNGTDPLLAQLRGQVSTDPTMPMVLVMGGGEGMGPLVDIATEIGHQLAVGGQPRAQMVVICGKNHQARATLLKRTWPIPVQIHGFVNNVQEWMAACDLAVTKAGPSTIAEALNHGLPILLTGYIPGQETQNVHYVVGRGAGYFSSNPRHIGQLVRRWLVDKPHEREQMAANAASLAQPHAALKIAQEIMEQMEHLLNK